MCIHCKEEYDEQALDSAVELGILLDKAAEICLNMDTPDCEGKVLGSRVCYTEKMGLNAVAILQSVLSNRAIHKGHITTEELAEKAGTQFYNFLLDSFGFDAVKAVEHVLDEDVPDQT